MSGPSKESTLRRPPASQTFDEDDDEESKVGFGTGSLFDFFVRSPDHLPFHLPVSRYLEEMLIGMHGAPEPGRSGAEHDAKCASVEAHANWKHMQHVLKSEAMQNACNFLFWICAGVICKRVIEDALIDLQHRLAASWYLVILEINNKVQNDAEARDWLLGALPVVLVQAIYRIMVDAFPDDRSLLCHHADQLLDKLTRVVFYEVAGFQLNDETCRRARRRLFKKNVLDNPHVNQHESLKSQMRRELLENQNKKMHPLTFGKQEGMPLEETQLEHVMMGREEERKKSQNSLSPAADKTTDLLSIVPEELSVDRYASVSQKGAELFQRHLEELLPPQEDTEAESENLAASLSGHAGRGKRPDAKSLPAPNTSKDKTDLTRKKTLSFQTTDPANLRKTAGSQGSRKTVMFGRSNSVRERREAEDRERRRREELLKQRIVDDPLPTELCERLINTTWVSPLTDRLVPGERDRQALRKRRDEAHLLKMAPPMPDMLPSIGKSSSAPSLRPGRRRGAGGGRGTGGAGGGPNEELPKLLQSGAPLEGDGQGGYGYSTGHSLSPMGDKPAGLDKAEKGNPTGMRGSARLGGEVKVLQFEKEPPITVKNDVVLYRLKDQLTQFNAKSFGVYMKEFDITSGQKKQRMDPEVMRRAESSYVSQLQALVGGPGSSGLKVNDSPALKAKGRQRLANSGGEGQT